MGAAGRGIGFPSRAVVVTVREGPKVQAACEIARHTGKVAVIGSLADIEAIVQSTAGTRISTEKPGIIYL